MPGSTALLVPEQQTSFGEASGRLSHEPNAPELYPTPELGEEWVDDPEFPLAVPCYPDYVPEIPDWATPEDPEYYPVHYEVNMPEIPRHLRQKVLLMTSLQSANPAHWVIRECQLHWTRQKPEAYVVPDVMVAMGPPNCPEERTFVSWRDPPIVLAAEVLSHKNTRAQIREKLHIYAGMGIPEVVTLSLRDGTWALYRLHAGVYQTQQTTVPGRVWSTAAQVWLGKDTDGHLRVWRATGELIGTYEEVEARADELQTELADSRKEAAEFQEEAVQLQEQLEQLHHALAQSQEQLAVEQSRSQDLARLAAELQRELAELRARLAGQEESPKPQ